MALPALSGKDAERLLRFVAEAESLGSDQPFTPELLVELGRLIEADWVTYHEMDHVHLRPLGYVLRPGDDDVEDDEDSPTDYEWEAMAEHPICRRWREDGRFGALRLSDVITRREFRRTRFYAEFFAPWGMEYELKIRLPSPPWHAKTFAFHRNGGRDFTARDRLVLDLLQPHLTRLWEAARTRRLLRAALAELERVSEGEPRGVVVLSPAGTVEFASPPARRLLREFFGKSASSLPQALARELEAGTGPLVRRRGARELTIEWSDGTLHLQERQVVADLTAREQEVLSWVARGKTNPEIAELLWLAPGTVRKHLENVFAKLGVSTRTAAVACFLGIIEAEAV
jgi:DNA-binding CsgD family transcriptional regulator